MKLYNNIRYINKIKQVIALTENKYLEIKPIKEKHIRVSDTIGFILQIKEEGQVIEIFENYTFYMKYDDINIFRFLVKFNNIVFPNMSGNYDELSISKIAKSELDKLLLNKTITLKNIRHRLQNIDLKKNTDVIYADVYLDDLHINKWMLLEKYAIPYDGRKKMRPIEWEDYVVNF